MLVVASRVFSQAGLSFFVGPPVYCGRRRRRVHGRWSVNTGCHDNMSLRCLQTPRKWRWLQLLPGFLTFGAVVTTWPYYYPQFRCAATNTPRTTTKAEDEERGECGLCLRARARLSGVPPMAPAASLPFVDAADSDWAPFLMLCNFEDGAFEVMHGLDSFPAPS